MLTPGDVSPQNPKRREQGGLMSKAILAASLFVAGVSPAFAGAIVVIPSIPTLDETGVIGLSLVIGIVAGLAARRRKRK
jgi:hypothetical protein